MEHDQSAREIHLNPTIRKNIPPYKNVVWRVKGGEFHHLKIKLNGCEVESDVEAGDDDRLEAGYVGGGFPNFVKSKFFSESGPQTRANSAGVDLGEDHNLSRTVKRRGRDADLDRWPELENLIDRLSNCDLGPAGFFVICHRDSDFRPA